MESSKWKNWGTYQARNWAKPDDSDPVGLRQADGGKASKKDCQGNEQNSSVGGKGLICGKRGEFKEY